jgi:hypothetical protein
MIFVIFRIPLQASENITAKIDGPMTFGYGIDAADSARKNQRCGTNICFSRQRAGCHIDDRPLVTASACVRVNSKSFAGL